MKIALSSSRDWFANVSPIGFGCCPMGRHGWGAVDEQQLIVAVREALDYGIQLFDTSDIYGLGISEQTLGRALGARRREAIIATKFGLRMENGHTRYDTSPAWIRIAIDGSLKRLGVECVDLYQMHYWDKVTPVCDIIAELERLQDQGKIRSYGVTNHDPQDPMLLAAASNIATYSFQYSLVDRVREDQILAVQDAPGPVFLSWGSLSQGLLSGKYSSLGQLDATDRRKRETYANFHGERFAAIQTLLPRLRELAAAAGASSLSQLALRWVIDRIPRGMPLVGIKHPEQIRDAAGALQFQLTSDILVQLDKLSGPFRAKAPAHV